MTASQGSSISVLEVVLFFALAIGVGIISRFLNARPRKRRKSRRSYRPPRPFWKDLLGWAIWLTLLWAILVAPTLLRNPGTLLHSEGLGATLTCGVAIAWIAIIGLWVKHRSHEIHRFERIRTVGDLLLLPHDEFEQFIAHLFRVKGNEATVVGRGGDHGVDVVIEGSSGQRAIVQCKRWTGKWVDESIVRDLYGAMMHDGPDTRGFLVTTSTFSQAARDWARGKSITLIDGERLAQAIGELRQTI